MKGNQLIICKDILVKKTYCSRNLSPADKSVICPLIEFVTIVCFIGSTVFKLNILNVNSYRKMPYSIILFFLKIHVHFNRFNL